MDNPCVEIVYESPDRVVLLEELIEYSAYTRGIWKVVDALEDAVGEWSLTFLPEKVADKIPMIT